MSYDVEVPCNSCGSSLNRKDSVPYGMAPLLQKIGFLKKSEERLADINGIDGIEMLPRIQSALWQLQENWDRKDLKAEFDRQEWSVVDFTEEWLIDLRNAFCKQPLSTLHIT